jgi:NADH-quinone oxidoreductase subunit L
LSAFSHPEPIFKVLASIGEVGALITVFYTFRMFFVAFLKRPSAPGDFGSRDLKIPMFMTWINLPLAILAISAAAINFPAAFGGSAWLTHYLASVPGGHPPYPFSETLEGAVGIGSGLLNIVVLVLAYLLYRPEARLLSTSVIMRPGLRDLLFSGFYLDRLYQIALVKPYQAVAKALWLGVDEGGIDDRFDGTGTAFRFFSLGLQLWTTGRLSTYLRMLLLGLTVMLCMLVLGWYTR